MRPEERGLIGAFILLSFLQGLSAVIGTAVGRSLFLASFDAADLPLAYAAVSLLLPTLGVLFIAASRRVPPPVLLGATAALSAVVYGGVWVALQAGMDRAAAAVAMVWVDVDWSLVLLVFLGLAAHRLDVRQQRRLLGIAAAGDIIAGVAAGYLLPMLVSVVGLTTLPLIAAGAQALATAVVVWLLAGHSSAERRAPTPVRQLLSDRFLRSAWAMLALGWFAFYVIDALFLSVASSHYPDEAEFAGFLGIFLGTTALADAVASLGLYALLLGRFGVLGGLLGGPVTTAVLACVVAVTAGAPGIVVLLLASALKLSDLTARENITEPAVSTLYGALPPADRSAAQAVGSTVVGPMVGLLAAPVLWLVLGPMNLGTQGLAGLAASLLLLTVLLALGLGRAWPDALRRALGREAPAQANVTLAGEAGQEAIVDGLMSPDPSLVVTAAGLLRRMGPGLLLDNLPALLAHRSTEVREGTARLLEETPLPGSEGKIAARMVDEHDMNVRALLYRALVSTNAGVGLDLLEARLDNEELGERGAALDALIRHGDERSEGLVLAGLDRMRAAGGREAELAQHLTSRQRSLSDGELLARLTRQSPWSLQEQLRRRRVGAEQVVRVAASGWKPLSASKKMRLATSLGVLAGRQARPVLIAMLGDGDGAEATLAALRGDEPLAPHEVEAVRRSLARDLEANPALRREAEMRPDAPGRRALAVDAQRALRRAVRAYGLLHPGEGLSDVWPALMHPDERPLALEILETVLPRDEWSRLEPLLPGSTSPLPIGRSSEKALSAWTRMCLADPVAAAERSKKLAIMRHIGFLADASDGLLAELESQREVREWMRAGSHPRELPERVRATLLIDHPGRREPLLRALAGPGAEPTTTSVGGSPLTLDEQEMLVSLGACRELADAPRGVKRALVAAAVPRQLAAREQLWERGATRGAAALVVSGHVDGRGAGTLLGVREALAPRPRSRRAEASSHAQVLLFDGAALLHAAAASGAVALALGERLVQESEE